MSDTDEDTGAVSEALGVHREKAKRRFVDGKYADLTIEVGERKWKVHKFIVCSGCDFFAEACDGRFKLEAAANTIKMPEDDPVAVSALLEYLYTSNFVLPTDRNGAPTYRQRIALIVAVYKLADKYVLSELMDLAEEKFNKFTEDGTWETEIPAMVDAVEDTPIDAENALQTTLIQAIASEYSEIFNDPGDYSEIHAALSRRPMLALKAARVWAARRKSRVKSYRCSSRRCIARKNFFEVSTVVKSSQASSHDHHTRESHIMPSWEIEGKAADYANDPWSFNTSKAIESYQ
nr:hypothetical protein B0A51_01998 [Rachicladosporium sp. CCFEE 5018]